MTNSFIRVAAASFATEVGSPAHNAEKIITTLKQAAHQKAALVVFPELCLCGYTCADLFYSPALLGECLEALGQIVAQTTDLNLVAAVGMPVEADDRLFNCGVVFSRGQILACVPKSHIPNYSEYYESRYFAPAECAISDLVELCGQLVPFGTDLVLRCDNIPGFCLACEICEDLWVPVSPSSQAAVAGATVIANLSASNDYAGKDDTRRLLVAAQSQKLKCAYIYSSSEQGESSTDLAFSGNKYIGVLGRIAAEEEGGSLVVTTVDTEVLTTTRRRMDTFARCKVEQSMRRVHFELPGYQLPVPAYNPSPFLPDPAKRDQVCREILDIQVAGLLRRVRSARVQKLVVGVSGGLDSTLALLVCVEAAKALGQDPSMVIAVTMPCFGTTSNSYNNSIALIKELGATLRVIDIKESVTLQLQMLGHDMRPDTTYENAQARQRMQLLMNLANMEGGLVVGTSDLSEIAIGFSTYGGDHMSMYNVNASVPKTLVRHIIAWQASLHGEQSPLGQMLGKVAASSITPELLPVDEQGNQNQNTESIVGSYELIDFILYHHIKYSLSSEKLLALLGAAFPHVEEAERRRACEQYFRRFYANQFKRSCMPDGIKATGISLSPRSDFRLPSDLDPSLLSRWY